LGGTGIIIGINIYLAIKLWTLAPKSEASPFSLESWQNPSVRIMMLIFLGVQAIGILLYVTQCKIIIVTDDGIAFINPLLPFIRKTLKWEAYDYYHLVEEHSIWWKYESVWLIKDNQLKDRFSSFYYSNYAAIKAGIRIENHGKLKLGISKQFRYWWGGKIKNHKK
jgi:hypothetical protein